MSLGESSGPDAWQQRNGVRWLLAVASAHFYLGIAPVPLRVICVAFVELRVQ